MSDICYSIWATDIEKWMLDANGRLLWWPYLGLALVQYDQMSNKKNRQIKIIGSTGQPLDIKGDEEDVKLYGVWSDKNKVWVVDGDGNIIRAEHYGVMMAQFRRWEFAREEHRVAEIGHDGYPVGWEEKA